MEQPVVLSGIDALLLASEIFQKQERDASQPLLQWGTRRSRSGSLLLPLSPSPTRPSTDSAGLLTAASPAATPATPAATAATTAADEARASTSSGTKRSRDSDSDEAGGRKKKTKTKTSQYKGVSFYQRTGKWECYFWLNLKELEENRPYLEELATDIWVAPSKNKQPKEGTKKGKQIYIGASYDEKASARIYDRACILIRNEKKKLNFPYSDYAHEMHLWDGLNPADIIKLLRAMSRGIDEDKGKGVESLEWLTQDFKEFVQQYKDHPRWKPKKSKYQGVYTPSDRPTKFVAVLRINKVSVHLGTTDTDVEAARLWDRAAAGLLGSRVKLNLQGEGDELIKGKASNEWQDLTGKELIKYVKKLVCVNKVADSSCSENQEDDAAAVDNAESTREEDDLKRSRFFKFLSSR